MGVLEEEFDAHRIPYHHIGKEIIQTKTTRYIFRNIHNPSLQNRTKHIDKLYVTKELLKHEDIKVYEHAAIKEWHHRPTGSLCDYLTDVKEEIPTSKVTRYEVEGGQVKKVEVETYKAHRTGYYEHAEEAEAVAVAWQEKEEVRRTTQQPVKPKRKSKKDIELAVEEKDEKKETNIGEQQTESHIEQLELLPL